MLVRLATIAVLLLGACAARDPLGSTAPIAASPGNVVNAGGGSGGNAIGTGAAGSGGGGFGGVHDTDTDTGTPGNVVVLASGQRSPLTLAIDESSVYWANDNNGQVGAADVSVAKVPLGGGAVTPLAWGFQGANGIAVDRSRVYFSGVVTTTAPQGNQRVRLMSVPLAGGPTTVVTTGLTNDPIVIGPGGVYGSGPAQILVAPLSGGAATPLLPNGTFDPSSFETYGIAVDAQFIYWTIFSGSPMSVMKAPIQGGPATMVTSVPGVAEGIAIDADSIYFGTGQGVWKVALAGGTATPLSSSPASGIAIDDAYVYFTDFAAGPGTVKKVAKSGGATITLATGLALPWGIAVDATSVYWTNAGDETGPTGTIMKLTPK
jgi:hypothetical protein